MPEMTTPHPIPAEVVEAVAKALYDDTRRSWRLHDWKDISDLLRNVWRERARAAIAAYIEQTGASK